MRRFMSFCTTSSTLRGPDELGPRSCPRARRPLNAYGLFARALVIEDPISKRRVYLGFLELSTGSPEVTKRVIERIRPAYLQWVSDRDGFDANGSLKDPDLAPAANNVLIMSSHTHSAPGHYTGNRLYDIIMLSPGGFRDDVIDIIVSAMEKAFNDARERLQDADIFVRSANAYGIGRNRSFPAFAANFDHRTAWPPVRPECAAPPDVSALAPEASAVDPYFWTLWAFPKGERDRALGTFAVVGIHNASVGRDYHLYHPDWAGLAAQQIVESGTTAWAAVAQGPAGDVTAIPVDGTMADMKLSLAFERSFQVVASWQLAKPSATDQAKPAQELDFGFYRWRPRDDGLTTWDIGTPVINGCDESRTPFRFDPGRGEARVATASMRGLQGIISKAKGLFFEDERRSEKNQLPKEPAFGAAQLVLRKVLGLTPGDEHPLHLLRIGSHVFFGLPTEVTTFAAWTIESALKARFRVLGLDWVGASPLAMVNDYVGYLTTAREYDTQNYEGALTMYGRRSLEVMCEVLVSTISQGATSFPESDGQRTVEPRGKLRQDPRPALPLPVALRYDELIDRIKRYAGWGSWGLRRVVERLVSMADKP